MIKLFNNKKKKAVSPEIVLQQKREKTAQQWIPIADIEGSIVYRKDNLLVSMLRVQPENLDLLSDNEKRRKVDMLAEGWNGETEGFQIFCIGRPVDSNNYLGWLQDKAKAESDFTRKMVLKGFIKEASLTASSGETIERRFYLIITKQTGNKADMELIQRLKDFQYKFSETELVSKLCTDDELLDVLSLFANPIQMAFEVAELQYDLPTLLVN